MPRGKKAENMECPVIDKVEEIVKESKIKNEFFYENTSNIPYELKDNTTEINLKAQVPFRMNPGDLRLINTGLKICLPKGVIGIIISNGVFDYKNQIGLIGNVVVNSQVTTDVTVAIKNFSNTYKIYNVGDVIAKMILVKSASLNF